MNELQTLLADIEKKKAEVAEAHRKLTEFKTELDEGFRKLQYLRLRVVKLVNDEHLDPRVKKLIEDAVNG